MWITPLRLGDSYRCNLKSYGPFCYNQPASHNSRSSVRSCARHSDTFDRSSSRDRPRSADSDASQSCSPSSAPLEYGETFFLPWCLAAVWVFPNLWAGKAQTSNRPTSHPQQSTITSPSHHSGRSWRPWSHSGTPLCPWDDSLVLPHQSPSDQRRHSRSITDSSPWTD